MTIERIQSDELYQGDDEAAYTRGLIAEGKFVFLSGQTAKNPDGFLMYAGDVAGQTRYVLESIERSLEAADTDMANVVRRRIFARDTHKFIECGAIDHLREFWPEGAQTTSTLVQVGNFSDHYHHNGPAEGVDHLDPTDSRLHVEIDVTAVIPD
jgi:enamine deaminase RidA (YjgF/YER057c/UK114 family)